jgi:hypothetical protein
MDNFYTYAYLREDGTPYYIGKGRGKRIHMSHGRCVSKPPVARRIKLKTGLSEEEAFRHEKYMIAVLGQIAKGTGILRNLTDGGEGASGATPWNKGRPCDYGHKVSEGLKRHFEKHGSNAESYRKAVETKRANGISFITTARPVQCVETGVIYSSAEEASRALGIWAGNILRVCRGIRKTAGKLHFIYHI